MKHQRAIEILKKELEDPMIPRGVPSNMQNSAISNICFELRESILELEAANERELESIRK